MIHIPITEFKNNLTNLLEQVITFQEPITICTEDGNAVMLSEEYYTGLLETLYLNSIPGLKESILEGASVPTSSLIPETEVQW
ncbi:MAG TPA: type II toxin-antitoxin system Phd/YefM family antitoxin [Sphaerochaeta sp.]|nr:type II toxin-antitoxin system Phd/YefM family antitoxin [Sphaerochaeta sp.]